MCIHWLRQTEIKPLLRIPRLLNSVRVNHSTSFGDVVVFYIVSKKGNICRHIDKVPLFVCKALLFIHVIVSNFDEVVRWDYFYEEFLLKNVHFVSVLQVTICQASVNKTGHQITGLINPTAAHDN